MLSTAVAMHPVLYERSGPNKGMANVPRGAPPVAHAGSRGPDSPAHDDGLSSTPIFLDRSEAMASMPYLESQVALRRGEY